jgi:hypothetical protein
VRLRAPHGLALHGVPLCPGRLESSGFASLTAENKEAINAFWKTYFSAGGETTEIKFDGAGILANTERGRFGGKPKCTFPRKRNVVRRADRTSFRSG